MVIKNTSSFQAPRGISPFVTSGTNARATGPKTELPSPRSDFGEFLLQAFGFVVARKAVNELGQFAFHDFGKLMKR
jgi:hypothetical protein